MAVHDSETNPAGEDSLGMPGNIRRGLTRSGHIFSTFTPRALRFMHAALVLEGGGPRSLLYTVRYCELLTDDIACDVHSSRDPLSRAQVRVQDG